MDAVVTAGGIPQPDEPLYSYSQGEAKALIDIAGKPMIQWVLDALGEAHTIERVVLIGLTDKSDLTCKKPLTYLSNQGKMLDNLKAGTAKVLELNPKAKYVLFVSSDIPGIKGEMVDWVVNTCLETRMTCITTSSAARTWRNASPNPSGHIRLSRIWKSAVAI